MEPTANDVLEAATFLLQQFILPDEDFLLGFLSAAGQLESAEDGRWREALTRALRPKDEDYARVFRGAAAEKARAGYAPMWQDPALAISPRDGQTQLRVSVALVQTMVEAPEAAALFPGGYRSVLGDLLPERHWVAWEYLEPGESHGMQYNGLVYLDGRFAWFPKPWRVLED